MVPKKKNKMNTKLLTEYSRPDVRMNPSCS